MLEVLLEVYLLVVMWVEMGELKMIDYNDCGCLKWVGFYLFDYIEEIDVDNE